MSDLSLKAIPTFYWLSHLNKVFNFSKTQVEDTNSTHYMVVLRKIIQESEHSQILVGSECSENVSYCYCLHEGEKLPMCLRPAGKTSPKR